MAKLLFFDTFHQEHEHDKSVSSGWSIINFPCFVVIEEILIVPNGARISERVPLDGRRHGQTHPPQFRLDFFACDANQQHSCTYEKLCMIDYNENTRTTVLPRLPFALNQLLCQGWYKSMTIAVFGSEAGDTPAVHLIHERRSKSMNLTSEVLLRADQPEPNMPPPPPNFMMPQPPPMNMMPPFPPRPPHPNFNPGFMPPPPQQQPRMDNLPPRFPPQQQQQQQRRPQHLPNFRRDSYEQQRNNNDMMMKQINFNNRHHHNQQQRHYQQQQQKHHHHNNQQRPTAEQPISNGAFAGSQEAVARGEEGVESMGAEEDDCPINHNEPFNPFESGISVLEHFRPPEETEYECLLAKRDSDEGRKVVKLRNAIAKYPCVMDDDHDLELMLDEFFERIRDKEKEWVETLEEIAPLVDPHLGVLERGDEVNARHVAAWAVAAVWHHSPLYARVGLNVRSIKAGLMLMHCVAATSSKNVHRMLTYGALPELYTLLRSPYTSSPVKLAALHCVDRFTNWPAHIDHLVTSNDDGEKSGYAHLVEMVLDNQPSRVAESLKRLLRKVNLYESMCRVCEQARSMSTQAYDLLHDSEDSTTNDPNDDSITRICIQEGFEQFYDDDDDSVDYNEFLHSETSTSEQENGKKSRKRRNSAEICLSDDDSGDNYQHGSSDDGEEALSHTTRRYSSCGRGGGDRLPPNLLRSLQWSTHDVSDEELSKIGICLCDIEQALVSCDESIAQLPMQVMPLKDQLLNQHQQLLVDKSNRRARIALIRMSVHTELLPSILILLTMPRVCQHRVIFASSYRIITHLMGTPDGILHVAGTHSAAMEQLARNLMSSAPELDVGRPNTAGHLGALIACNMHLVQNMDVIGRVVTCDVIEPDDVEDLVEALRSLLALHYLPWGKLVVARALAFPNMFALLLKCIAHDDDDDQDDDGASEDSTKNNEDGDKKKNKATTRYKSAVNSYASLLLLNALKRNDRVEYLTRSDELMELVTSSPRCDEFVKGATKGGEIVSWLRPVRDLRNGTSKEDQIIKLVDGLKSMCEEKTIQQHLPSVCTSLRLIIQLCSVERDAHPTRRGRMTLRRVVGVGLLMHADAYNGVLKLGESLAEHLLPLTRSNLPMNIEQHTTVVSVLTDVFHLLRAMLGFLMSCRTVDTVVVDADRVVSVVVQLYQLSHALLWSVDENGVDMTTRQAVAILSYLVTPLTNSLCIKDDRSDTKVQVTGGERVLTAICEHARKRCDHFISSLRLLTNLLPIPLAFDEASDLEEKDVAYLMTTHEKWWRIDVETCREALTSLLCDLMTSSSPGLRFLVVSCAHQLCNVSYSYALHLVANLFDRATQWLKSEEDEEERKMESHELCAFAALSEFITAPFPKAVLISVLNEARNAKLKAVWKMSERCDHLGTVKTILEFAVALLDDRYAPRDDDRFSWCNLPSIGQIQTVMDAVMARLMRDDADDEVTERCALLLALVASQRATRKFALHALSLSANKTQPLGVAKLVQTIARLATAEEEGSAALRRRVEAMTRHLVTFVDALMTSSHDGDVTMGFGHVKQLVGGSAAVEKLTRIERFLDGDKSRDHHDINEVSRDDVTLDRLSAIRQQLASKSTECESFKTGVRLETAPLISLKHVFKHKPCSRDDVMMTRRHVTTELLMHEADDDVIADDEVVADLKQLSEKFGLKELKLADEISFVVVSQRGATSSDTASSVTSSPGVGGSEFSSLRQLGKRVTFTKRSHNSQPLNASPGSAGGSGGGEGGQTNHNHRPYDLFRHRKQNTSRPPSMHVDDYIAADTAAAAAQHLTPPSVSTPKTSSDVVKSPPVTSSSSAKPLRNSGARRTSSARSRGGFSMRDGDSSGGGGGQKRSSSSSSFPHPAQQRFRYDERSSYHQMKGTPPRRSGGGFQSSYDSSGGRRSSSSSSKRYNPTTSNRYRSSAATGGKHERNFTR